MSDLVTIQDEREEAEAERAVRLAAERRQMARQRTWLFIFAILLVLPALFVVVAAGGEWWERALAGGLLAAMISVIAGTVKGADPRVAASGGFPQDLEAQHSFKNPPALKASINGEIYDTKLATAHLYRKRLFLYGSERDLGTVRYTYLMVMNDSRRVIVVTVDVKFKKGGSCRQIGYKWWVEVISTDTQIRDLIANDFSPDELSKLNGVEIAVWDWVDAADDYTWCRRQFAGTAHAA